MTQYKITIERVDDGSVVAETTDEVAEGETDEFTIRVDNPSIVADVNQTSGN